MDAIAGNEIDGDDKHGHDWHKERKDDQSQAQLKGQFAVFRT
jgi:hypothetical protein